ncbi:MAG: diaminopimelate epimerase [Oligoflexia bacterium]|nr:diaminopimelate epimerase [Oligoflexia bacterium]
MKDLPFRKLEGCGNSFVILDHEILNDSGLTFKTDALAINLCSPGLGVGADGLMIVGAPKSGLAKVIMRNPDGSSMGMCGNGVRCVVRHLVLSGMLPTESGSVVLDVEGRRISCAYEKQAQWVQVDMGKPSFAPADVPHTHQEEMLRFPLSLGGESFEINSVSMGNPHCVIFCAAPDAVNLQKIGALLEHCHLFPARTNVEFVSIESRELLHVRVWERGAGATLACGTGACASFVVASRLGLVGEAAQVRLPGGSLEVSWKGGDSVVYLHGPAREICRGDLPLAVLSARLRERGV